MEKKANEVLFSHHVALPAKWIYWQLWEIILNCNFLKYGQNLQIPIV